MNKKKRKKYMLYSKGKCSHFGQARLIKFSRMLHRQLLDSLFQMAEMHVFNKEAVESVTAASPTTQRGTAPGEGLLL